MKEGGPGNRVLESARKRHYWPLYQVWANSHGHIQLNLTDTYRIGNRFRPSIGYG